MFKHILCFFFLFFSFLPSFPAVVRFRVAASAAGFSLTTSSSVIWLVFRAQQTVFPSFPFFDMFIHFGTLFFFFKNVCTLFMFLSFSSCFQLFTFPMDCEVNMDSERAAAYMKLGYLALGRLEMQFVANTCARGTICAFPTPTKRP